MPAPEELTLQFAYERNVFGSGEGRTIIGVCEEHGLPDFLLTWLDGQGVIVKGKALEGALETGLTYRFYGYWTTHPKYGRQFTFQSFVLATPAGRRGTIAYLKRRKGIGPKRAREIWDAFKADSLKVLKSEPAKVAAKVKGLTTEAAEAAGEYFRSIESLEKVTIELAELLGNRGFPRTVHQQVLERWGNRAPEVIRENPYRLMVVKGAGFLRTDRLYLELGRDPAALTRQKWCIWHALHSDQNGHTWYPIAFARKHLAENIAGAEVKFEEALEEALTGGIVVVRADGGEEQWIAEREKAGAEARLANFVHEAEAEEWQACP